MRKNFVPCERKGANLNQEFERVKKQKRGEMGSQDDVPLSPLMGTSGRLNIPN